MISGIRNIEKALGSGVKEPMPCEIENMSIARKSLVASELLQKEMNLHIQILLQKDLVQVFLQ